MLDSDLFRSAWFRFTFSESHPLGPRAVQPSNTCDHPRGEPRGLLPDVDGGAGESGHLQHRAAQHRHSPSTDDYWRPSPGPVPHVHSSPQANEDLLPLDRLHNGREEEDVEPESTKFSNL